MHLMVDQRIGNFKGPTRELALERVANMPNFGQDNLLFIKRLRQSLHMPVIFHPTSVVAHSHRGKNSIQLETQILEMRSPSCRREHMARRISWTSTKPLDKRANRPHVRQPLGKVFDSVRSGPRAYTVPRPGCGNVVSKATDNRADRRTGSLFMISQAPSTKHLSEIISPDTSASILSG